MTVNTVQIRFKITGDLASPYAGPYAVLASDVGVYYEDPDGDLTRLAQDSDYRVDGVGVPSGVNVTILSPSFVPSVASNTALWVVSEAAPNQPISLPEQKIVITGSVERAMDRLAVLVQQLWDRADRSIQTGPFDDSDAFLTIPDLLTRQDSIASFNANGDFDVIAKDVFFDNVVVPAWLAILRDNPDVWQWYLDNQEFLAQLSDLTLESNTVALAIAKVGNSWQFTVSEAVSGVLSGLMTGEDKSRLDELWGRPYDPGDGGGGVIVNGLTGLTNLGGGAGIFKDIVTNSGRLRSLISSDASVRVLVAASGDAVDVTLALADHVTNGAMSYSDKIKLDGVAVGLTALVDGSFDGSANYPVAPLATRKNITVSGALARDVNLVFNPADPGVTDGQEYLVYFGASGGRALSLVGIRAGTTVVPTQGTLLLVVYNVNGYDVAWQVVPAGGGGGSGDFPTAAHVTADHDLASTDLGTVLWYDSSSDLKISIPATLAQDATKLRWTKIVNYGPAKVTVNAVSTSAGVVSGSTALIKAKRGGVPTAYVSSLSRAYDSGVASIGSISNPLFVALMAGQANTTVVGRVVPPPSLAGAAMTPAFGPGVNGYSHDDAKAVPLVAGWYLSAPPRAGQFDHDLGEDYWNVQWYLMMLAGIDPAGGVLIARNQIKIPIAGFSSTLSLTPAVPGLLLTAAVASDYSCFDAPTGKPSLAPAVLMESGVSDVVNHFNDDTYLFGQQAVAVAGTVTESISWFNGASMRGGSFGAMMLRTVPTGAGYLMDPPGPIDVPADSDAVIELIGNKARVA